MTRIERDVDRRRQDRRLTRSKSEAEHAIDRNSAERFPRVATIV